MDPGADQPGARDLRLASHPRVAEAGPDDRSGDQRAGQPGGAGAGASTGGAADQGAPGSTGPGQPVWRKWSGALDGQRSFGRIAVLILGQRGFLQRMVDDLAEGGQGTHRIGIGGVAGERKRLTAAAAEVHRLARTAPAGLLHPAVPPKYPERLRLLPNPVQRMRADVVEAEARDLSGPVAGQDAP